VSGPAMRFGKNRESDPARCTWDAGFDSVEIDDIVGRQVTFDLSQDCVGLNSAVLAVVSSRNLSFPDRNAWHLLLGMHSDLKIRESRCEGFVYQNRRP